MHTSLFREEVVQARSDRLWGDLIISQPVPLRVLVWFLTLLVLLAGLFLALNSYTRKQSVAGWLEPDLGVVDIFPPIQGTVTDLLVQQGDEVRKGQLLLRLVADQRYHQGQTVTDATVELLAEQQGLLDDRLAQESLNLTLGLDRHARSLQGLKASLQQGRETLAAERAILELHNKAMDRAEQLQASGTLARAGVEEVQLRVLNQQAVIERQQATLVTLENTLREAESEGELLRRTSQERRNLLLQERAELGNRLLQQQASRTIDVVASTTGSVGMLNVHAGQFVDGSQPVLSLLPAQSMLQARLKVPASAIGFVQEGQRVRFRYSAYAFQKFGVQEGRVISISRNASSADVTSAQPVYEIIASIDSQQMQAYGQEIPLRPGITLSADIVLDERSLLEWLLEPLYSLGKSL